MLLKYNKYLCFVITLFLFLPFIHGQPFSFTLKQISSNEGLPGSTVRCIEEDKNGFIWLGIEAMGACRYDGSNFVFFRSDPNNPKSISNDYVTTIFCDDSNIVWIGTENGLNRYVIEKGGFQRIIHTNNLRLSQDYRINCVSQNKQGQLLIGSNTGMEIYDRETGTLKSVFPFKDSSDFFKHDARVNAILQEGEDTYWLGTKLGLYFIDIKNKTLARYLNNNFTGNVHSDWIHAMCYSSGENSIYIATHSGVYEFDKAGKSFRLVHLGLIDREAITYAGFSNMIEDDGLLWLSSFNNGVVVIHPKKRSENIVEFNQRLNEVIKSKSIRHIQKTNDGNILIGTRFEGLYIYNKKQLTFPHWTKTGSNGLSDNYVISIYEDNNQTIWIGTKSRGLNRFDRKPGTFKNYLFYNESNEFIEAYNRIEVIAQDKSGVMWLGTPTGIVRFNPINGNYKYFEFKPTSYIFEDKDGLLWIGTIAGLYVFDRKTEEFFKPPFNYDVLQNEEYSISQIFEDFSGQLWIGTSENGLYQLNSERTKLKEYKNYIERPWGNGGNSIRDIFQSHDSTLWIATKFDGIHYYKSDNDSFINYTVENGLPSNSVYFMLEDQHGYLWLGTEKGITKFDPQNISFQNYDVSYGLQSNRSELLANARCKNGLLIIGGHNGFNMFDPDKIKPDKHCPNLILLTIRSQDDIIARDIKGETSLDLKYWQNFLSFNFTQIDLINARTSQYGYMLEGIDDQWIKSNNIGYVRYTNLKPGHYIFNVVAKHTSPLCNVHPIKVHIYIHPPPWRTAWAYAFYILFIGFSIWITYRISTMRVRYRRQEELTQMKLSFFTQISHEFRTPITLIISSLHDLFREQVIKPEGMGKMSLLSRNVTRLNKLINQFLDFRAIEHGVRKMEFYKGDIIRFIKEVYLLFDHLSQEKKIQFDFVSERNSYETVFDPDKVEKIISNLLSNAFKFTPAGKTVKIILSFVSLSRVQHLKAAYFKSGKTSSEYIEIKVVDTGIGMSKNQQNNVFEAFHSIKENNPSGTGIGLFYVKRLINLYKGDISLASNPGKGTTFIVHLPLDINCFKEAKVREGELDIIKYFQNLDTSLIPDNERAEEVPDETQGRFIMEDGIVVKDEKPVVLIAEDNDELREYLSGEISKTYRVLKAKDGVEGLMIADKEGPDLVISDIMMPGMDGLTLCENLKSKILTSHIPVILLTAKSALENKMEGYRTGADDYITKPFDTPLLLIRINNLLENRRKIREKFSSKLDFDVKEVSTNDVDKQFLDKLIAFIENNISDKDLTIEVIADGMNMERTTLYKKVKALIGKSPSKLLNEVKIKNAVKLLGSGNYSINQVADMVGFTSPSYFSSTFLKVYGKTPSDFIKNNK